MTFAARITIPLVTIPLVTIPLRKESPMRIQYLIIAAIFLVSLVGCGGSSGNNSGSSGGGGVTFPPNVQGQVLGSRNVPGGMITVSSDGPIQQSAANVFHLTLSPDMPVPTGVRAWIGITYDPATEGIQATPVATSPGSYDVTVTVPSPVAVGSHVWVRLSFADGSVVVPAVRTSCLRVIDEASVYRVDQKAVTSLTDSSNTDDRRRVAST